MIDVLVFNPPYVPSESLPDREEGDWLEIACSDVRDGLEIEDRTLDTLAEALNYWDAHMCSRVRGVDRRRS